MNSEEFKNLPVAIIGAGPIGLAAAAHLLERGVTPLVLEAGSGVGENVKQWRHVRMFSPWRYNVDRASKHLLEKAGWTPPDDAHLPNGEEIVSQYLQPLGTQTELRHHIRLDSKVIAITRAEASKVRTKDRENQPFLIRVASSEKVVSEFFARAVIDASGTWNQPNPMGAGGLPPLGEESIQDQVEYGIPDVRGTHSSRFKGATVLVVGSGHSAFNVVLDLLALKKENPSTNIIWVMRKQSLSKVFGGGDADALPARGALGQHAKEAVETGAVKLLTPFTIQQLARSDDGRITVSGDLPDGAQSFCVDRIIVTTGFRPELSFLREIRLDLDPALESVRALGPLIDPNEHSCGSVRPHGALELAHPERDFYIVGMKSYGRAPTFLLATGYEQVRSVAAELVGDHEAARRVELDLPETGVCSLDPEEPSECCDGASSREVEQCCGEEAPKDEKPKSRCCG